MSIIISEPNKRPDPQPAKQQVCLVLVNGKWVEMIIVVDAQSAPVQAVSA